MKKTNIISWAYLGLIYLLLHNILSFSFSTASLYLLLPIIMIVVSIIAIFGLIKKTSWARTVIFIAIGVEACREVFAAIYMHFFIPSQEVLVGMIISPLIYGVLLLFLAYKIYTSESLKDHLSSPPHATT